VLKHSKLVNRALKAKGRRFRAKDNGGMGSLYRSQHELVFGFQTRPPQAPQHVQLDQFGRNRSNVWRYSGRMEGDHEH
jgi:hypothetical protein